MKKFKHISSLLLITLLVFSSMIMPASASTNWGDGNRPTVNKAGGWNHAGGDVWMGSGSTPAWKAFEKAAGNRHNGSSKDVYKNPKAAVDSLNQGGGGDLTLYEACRRSEYIWWYGENDRDTFYTRIGRNAHPTAEKMPYSTHDSRDMFAMFLNTPGNGWNKNEGTVLVCSYPLESQGKSLTLRSNSGAFDYDGTPKTVDGYQIVAGNVIDGDVLDAAASSTRTEVGSQTVEFIKDSKVNALSGVNYTINHQYGKLHIMPEEEDTVENCRTTSSEKVKEITQNDLKVDVGTSYGWSAEDIKDIRPLERTNDAYYLVRHNPPAVGDTITKWKEWKEQFIEGGKDHETEKLDLVEYGLDEPMRKYGGVLNITRINWESEVDVTFCQPQKRDRIHETDEDGNVSSYWSAWYDDPAKEEVIEKRSLDINGDDKKYSYQILGVNCNAEGFEKLKEYLEEDLEEDLEEKIDFSYSEADGSGLLQTPATPLEEGTSFPLGKEGITGDEEFFNPSLGEKWTNSCKIFKCISDVLESAEHDAKNNLGINPLFTHKDDTDYQNPKDGHEKGHGYPEENEDFLNIFRDNEDREIRADVWYPKETEKEDLTVDPKEAAKETVARIFEKEEFKDGEIHENGEEVTPEIGITTIHSWGNETQKLAKVDKDYTFTGHHNSFNMKSMWASDENKPYRLGVDWVYEAEAINVGPGVVDGHKMHRTSEPETFPFEVHCTFINDSSVENHDAIIPDTPHIDGSILADPKDSGLWDISGRIKTLFTRSVSDRSNTE